MLEGPLSFVLFESPFTSVSTLWSRWFWQLDQQVSRLYELCRFFKIWSNILNYSADSLPRHTSPPGRRGQPKNFMGSTQWTTCKVVFAYVKKSTTSPDAGVLVRKLRKLTPGVSYSQWNQLWVCRQCTPAYSGLGVHDSRLRPNYTLVSYILAGLAELSRLSSISIKLPPLQLHRWFWERFFCLPFFSSREWINLKKRNWKKYWNITC